MKRLWESYASTVATLLALAVVGTAVMGYILVNQRFPNPLVDTYEVRVALPSADGVTPGSGQPVKVSGVPVGVISDLELRDGRALITMQIRRDELAVVRADARATLRPISPLKDLQIILDPGTAAAAPLPEGGLIPVERAAAPVDLDEILAALDTDTRAFLTTLVGGTGAALDGQGPNMRRVLKALAPTTAQVDELAETLATRRRQIRRLVSNVSTVARAASDDERLSELVQAGNATLEAIAAQERPLRAATAELPRAIDAVGAVLPSLTRVADELSPTLDRYEPILPELPAALSSAGEFSRVTAAGLEKDLRPFARESAPVVLDVSKAVTPLAASAPKLDSIARVLTYLVNEAVYNPPGDNEGMLFWLDWAAHNIVSTTSTADANGTMVRATIFVSCALAQGLPGVGPLLAEALGATPLCPSGPSPETR